MDYDFRSKKSSDVVPLVQNNHFIKIKGAKYYLSDDGGPLGSPDAFTNYGEGGARLILGPEMGKFKYLWVYDTDRQIVVMWRAHDGNEKVNERASGMASKIKHLEKRRQMNRVDHSTYLIIDRQMKVNEQANLEALKAWNKELESDFQKTVNERSQEYFDRMVRPDIDRAVAAVASGVVPIGYKAFDDNPANQTRYMTTNAISKILSRNFTEEKVSNYLRSKGIDVDAPNVDNQAVYWAVNEIVENTYAQYLPERVSGE